MSYLQGLRFLVVKGILVWFQTWIKRVDCAWKGILGKIIYAESINNSRAVVTSKWTSRLNLLVLDIRSAKPALMLKPAYE